MIITIIILSLVLIAVITVTFILFKKLNAYISKIEVVIQQNLELTENLKQSFRDVLVDHTFLMDDGKIKPMLIQKEKSAIINGLGARVEEENVEL